jgi:hypothetical protein
LALLMLIISAYSFYKKMLEWNYWQPFFWNLHHCFWLSSFFGCPLRLFLSGVLMDFRWWYVKPFCNWKPRSHAGSRSCCKFNFCRLFKRIGAFESGLTAKLMGTECSGLWRKHDLNYCFLTGVLSTLEN